MGHSDKPREGDPANEAGPVEAETVQGLNRRLRMLSSEVHRLTELLENLRLQQYVQALLNVRRIAWMSFFTGILNGLGAAIGATLVLALLLYILSRLEVLPHIGKFVSEIVKIVQQQKP